MDDVEATKQIEQMVGFILNEAKDRASQIMSDAAEDFNKEKLKLVMSMKEKCRTQNAKKLKESETKTAIEKSTAINRSRLKKIEARQQCIEGLQSDATAQLQQVSKNDAKYKQILVELIVQGCLKLNEDDIAVRCRQVDQNVVKSVLDQAAQAYSKTVKKACNVNKAVKLSVDSKFLPATCVGGVSLVGFGGLIIVDNTLDQRLTLVMENDRPALRKMLFPH